MQLVYNGIDLGWIQTQSIHQEAEYSEDDVDYLWTKVSIVVRSVLNLDVSPPADSKSDAGPDQTMNRIRALLLTPRQTLEYNTGEGGRVFLSPNTGCPCDINNGPKPRYCNIISLNEKTWIIEYAIDTWISEMCGTCGSVTPGSKAVPIIVLSNRWGCDVEIDRNWYTKRHISGTARLRTDSAVSIDSFRDQIIPTLPPHFVRTNMRFAISTDQTKLDYSFTDEERYVVPPPPATRFEAEYACGNKTFGKGMYPEQITVRVWGNRCTPKAALVVAAVKIAVGRLFISGLSGAGVLARTPDGAVATLRADARVALGTKPVSGSRATPIFIGPTKKIKSASFRDHLHENYVEVHMETLGPPLASTAFGFLGLPGSPTTGHGTVANNLNYVVWDGTITDFGTDTPPGQAGTAGIAFLKHLFEQPCVTGRPQRPDTDSSPCVLRSY